MSFPGCCSLGINLDIIIYFCLLHNQGGIFKIVSTISHVLLFMNGFMLSVLIVIPILLWSMANSGFHKSIFFHCVASTGCLIILTSCLCFSLCHCNNSDSFFTNQHLKRGMIRKYKNIFLGPPFLLLQFLSSPPSFLRLNRSSLQIGHFLRSLYLGPWYRMQSFLHAWIFPPPNRTNRLSILPYNGLKDCIALGNISLRSINKFLKLPSLHLLLTFNWKIFTITNNLVYWVAQPW
jgi:hypothetical protein